jgi:hypothetical protein
VWRTCFGRGCGPVVRQTTCGAWITQYLPSIHSLHVASWLQMFSLDILVTSQTNKWTRRPWRRLMAGFSLLRPQFDRTTIPVDFWCTKWLSSTHFYYHSILSCQLLLQDCSLPIPHSGPRGMISPDHRRKKKRECDENHRAERTNILTSGRFGYRVLEYTLHYRPTPSGFTSHRSSTKERFALSVRPSLPACQSTSNKQRWSS